MRSPEKEAPPPLASDSLSELRAFLFMVTWKVYIFQNKRVEIIESSTWLMQEAETMSKCRVQLCNHNGDKYNEMRTEKVIPSR